MSLESEILAFLPLYTGYCVGAFVCGFVIGYLLTFFNKLSEKV